MEEMTFEIAFRAEKGKGKERYPRQNVEHARGHKSGIVFAFLIIPSKKKSRDPILVCNSLNGKCLLTQRNSGGRLARNLGGCRSHKEELGQSDYLCRLGNAKTKRLSGARGEVERLLCEEKP